MEQLIKFIPVLVGVGIFIGLGLLAIQGAKRERRNAKHHGKSHA